MYATVLLSLISLKTFLLGISNKNLNISQMSPYLIRIEGPPPKRNVVGSSPIGDAICKGFRHIDSKMLMCFFCFQEDFSLWKSHKISAWNRTLIGWFARKNRNLLTWLGETARNQKIETKTIDTSITLPQCINQLLHQLRIKSLHFKTNRMRIYLSLIILNL